MAYSAPLTRHPIHIGVVWPGLRHLRVPRRNWARAVASTGRIPAF